MNIIITSPIIAKEEQFIEKVKKCKECNINIFRFNLSRLNSKKMEEELRKRCITIRRIIDNPKIIYDIPFPGKNPRMFRSVLREKFNKGEIIKCYNNHYSNTSSNYIDVDNLEKYFIHNKSYLIQDGEGIIKVIRVSREEITFKFENSFELRSGKAILCERLIENSDCDQTIVENINRLKPEYVWFSFVKNLKFLPHFIEKIHYVPQYYFKIENEDGVNNIDNIMKAGEGIIVARGDLALNIKCKGLYEKQQYITNVAHRENKRVVVATGILNSMKNMQIPSRAELVDIELIVKNKCENIVLNTALMYADNLKKIVDLIKDIELNNINES